MADDNNLAERVIRLETRIKADRAWFAILGALLLSFLGYSSLVAIPDETNRHVKEKIQELAERSVDEWFERNRTELMVDELEKRASEISKVETTVINLLSQLEKHKKILFVEWQSVTLENGWTNYGSVYAPLEFTKDASGIIHLRGMVKGGRMGLPGFIFQLPTQFRPEIPAVFPVACHGPIPCEAIVTEEGKVYLETGSTNWTGFDGVSFPGKRGDN